MFKAFSFGNVVWTVIVLFPALLPAQTYRSHTMDGIYEVTIAREALERSPAWAESDPHPPFSARRAISLASTLTEKKLFGQNDKDYNPWTIDSLTIKRASKDKWYGLVKYECLPKGGFGGSPFVLTLVVLMDGTVPEPKKVREQNY